MGQTKSKVAALEEQHGDAGLVGVKAKKSSRQRKWRKKKGYSLSVSLEGELNRDVDSGSLAGRSARDGPVLVSYNVWKGENELLSRRNSYQHGSTLNDLTTREEESGGTITCMNNHQPLQHPDFAHENIRALPEQENKSNDYEKNDQLQPILTKNTLNSNVFIPKEEPPSPKTKTRNDDKNLLQPTLFEDSSVLSASSSQGK